MYTVKFLKAFCARNESGMTLLEVVSSLALLALVLGVISEFLFTGVRIWAKSDLAYRRQYQFKYIFQTMATDLETTFTGDFLPENAFSGSETKFKFWADNTSKGLLENEYRYDSEAQSVIRSSNLWGAKPEEKCVFTEITEWKLEYFDPEKENWTYIWEPSSKAAIPSLIRLNVKTKTGNLGTLTFLLHTARLENKT